MTSGGGTPQFLRRRTERQWKKDAAFAELSGPDDNHLDADALLTPESSRLPGAREDGDAGSGALPYDPHTNYLSPRPRFLRYNPGRLTEIYLRREMGAEGRSSREGTPASSLPSSPPPPSSLGHGLGGLARSDDEEDEDDGDRAEEEEPSWWNLVWKVLILLGIFFTTGYISSMRSSPASLDGFCREVGGEQPQKSKSVVPGFLDHLVDDVTPNAKIVSSGEESQSETQMKEPEKSDLKVFLAVSGEEGDEHPVHGGELDARDEMVADESELLVNDENLSGGFGPVEGEEEVLVNAGVVQVRVETEECSSTVCYLEEGEKKNIRDAISEEQVGDLRVAAGIEDPLDMELEKGEAAESPESEAISDCAEKDGSFQEGGSVRLCGTDEGTESPERAVISDCAEKDGSSVGGGGGGFSLYGTDEGAESPEREAVSDSAEKDGSFEGGGGGGFSLYGTDEDAEYPEREAISDCEEKDGSFEGGGDGGGGVSLKVVAVTALMAVAFAATITFLRLFPSPRESKTLAKDDASSSEGGFKSPTTKELKRGFDLLANSGRFGDRESHCSDVELIRERPSDSSTGTENYEEPHGFRPPTVELIGEFSVAELGFSRTGNYSTGKKAARTNGRQQQSPEISMSNSIPSVDQSPSESSMTESALQMQPDREVVERKQKQRHGTREAVSTPLRRSSRIRKQVVSP